MKEEIIKIIQNNIEKAMNCDYQFCYNPSDVAAVISDEILEILDEKKILTSILERLGSKNYSKYEYEVTIDVDKKNIDGYIGFQTCFTFDKSNKVVKIGISE